MPTYQKAPKEIERFAEEILNRFESHKPLLDAAVKVDFIMAYADRDEDTGETKDDAIRVRGQRAFGVTRKISTKDRAAGRGDAEIVLDGDWWKDADERQQAALMDHELHHISVVVRKGAIQFDDLGRPQLKLRKHTIEVGWFAVIAERHGEHSMEQIQAKMIMDALGQYFWPQIAPANSDGALTVSIGGKTAKKLAAK